MCVSNFSSPRGEEFLFDLYHLPLHHAAVKTDFALVSERDDAVLACVERVVFAHQHILAREKLRAALADENVAGLCPFTRVELHPQELRV